MPPRLILSGRLVGKPKKWLELLDYADASGVIDTMVILCHGDGRGCKLMPRVLRSDAKRPRISLDVAPAVRRRIRLAAARRDVSVRQYILDALQERLREDLTDDGEEIVALTAKADPVLADLWDNDKDAAYDRL